MSSSRPRIRRRTMSMITVSVISMIVLVRIPGVNCRMYPWGIQFRRWRANSPSCTTACCDLKRYKFRRIKKNYFLLRLFQFILLLICVRPLYYYLFHKKKGLKESKEWNIYIYICNPHARCTHNKFLFLKLCSTKLSSIHCKKKNLVNLYINFFSFKNYILLKRYIIYRKMRDRFENECIINIPYLIWNSFFLSL